MRDAALPGGPQPFADDAAGAGYFSSDHHHRYLAESLVRQLAKGCNVVLVSGAPPADGELLTRFVDEVGSKYRASVVACHAGMNFNDLMLAYSRQLGIGINRDKGRLWALLSHLMLETRRGITRVLILDHAETLDPLCFDELLRFSQLDAPRPVPIVLLAPPSFTNVLTTPALEFVNAAITGRLAVDRLAPEEVGAFIQYQLNGHSEAGKTPFSSELIALIATAADGNPAVINALAREIVLSAKPRRLTVDEMREPDALPVERAEAPPANVETTAAETEPAPAPMATAEKRHRRAGRQGMDLQIAGYLALSVLIGAGLLYALVPWRSPPAATTTTALIIPAVMPAAERGAAAAVPSVPPETAAAPATETETAPSETASPTQDASVDAAPPTPKPDAPSATLLTAGSTDQAAPPAPEPPVPSPPVEPSDNAAPAPPAVPSAASAEPPETTAATPSATDEALAQVEPQAAPPEVAAVPPPATPPQIATVPPQVAPPQVADVPPQVANVAPQVVPPPPTEAASAEVTVMLQRGDQLFATGDIVSARQFYERAAISGNAAALCGVGKSFDPLVLRNSGVLGLVGDAATAILWYHKAAAAGSEEAALRLKRLAAVHRLDSQRR